MPAAPWAWENPVKAFRPTGKWRARQQQWTGKLVLQVEIERDHCNHLDKMQRMTATTYIWRDATAHELAQLAAKHGGSLDTTPPSEAYAAV